MSTTAASSRLPSSSSSTCLPGDEKLGTHTFMSLVNRLFCLTHTPHTLRPCGIWRDNGKGCPKYIPLKNKNKLCFTYLFPIIIHPFSWMCACVCSCVCVCEPELFLNRNTIAAIHHELWCIQVLSFCLQGRGRPTKHTHKHTHTHRLHMNELATQLVCWQAAKA